MSDRVRTIIALVLGTLVLGGCLTYMSVSEANCDGDLVRGVVGYTCVNEPTP